MQQNQRVLEQDVKQLQKDNSKLSTDNDSLKMQNQNFRKLIYDRKHLLQISPNARGGNALRFKHLLQIIKCQAEDIEKLKKKEELAHKMRKGQRLKDRVKRSKSFNLMMSKTQQDDEGEDELSKYLEDYNS